MHLLLKTRVNQPLTTVWQGFDSSLFDRLSPPFPPVDVIRFDGCLKGDVVHLRLNFLLFRQDWISLIVDQQTTDNEIYFVDQGTRLPFFLAYWQHHHRLLRNSNGGTIVIDDIVFRTPFRFTDLLIYPLLWLLFAYRKPIYKRTFK
jgi:ligand-binding SRPBCC domain-containing protein